MKFVGGEALMRNNEVIAEPLVEEDRPNMKIVNLKNYKPHHSYYIILQCVGISKVPAHVYITYLSRWVVRQPSSNYTIVLVVRRHQTTPNSIDKNQKNY